MKRKIDNTNNETRNRQMQFVSVATKWFAEAKNMSRQEAFEYLQKYQGIKFLKENYEYEQTLPKIQIIDDLTTICKNNKAQPI